MTPRLRHSTTPSRRRARAVLAACAAATLVLPLLAGWLCERRAEAADAQRFPPPGRLLDVGGRRLHILCIGRGSPTVLFDPSGFSNALSASAAREALAARATVCSYDRAGTGWSDAAPDPLSADILAADLGRVVDATAPGARVVIVASSIGGLSTELFARLHPERVTGLVFADAATSDLVREAQRFVSSMAVRAACVAVPVAARFGVIRLLDPFEFHPSRSEDAARSAAVTYRPGPWRTLCALVRGYSATRAAFAQAPAWPSRLPLVVLSAERLDGLLPPGFESNADSLRPLLRSAHQALARRSASGQWRLVPGSGHLIASSRPRAVVDAVLEVLAAAGRP